MQQNGDDLLHSTRIVFPLFYVDAEIDLMLSESHTCVEDDLRPFTDIIVRYR